MDAAIAAKTIQNHMYRIRREICERECPDLRPRWDLPNISYTPGGDASGDLYYTVPDLPRSTTTTTTTTQRGTDNNPTATFAKDVGLALGDHAYIKKLEYNRQGHLVLKIDVDLFCRAVNEKLNTVSEREGAALSSLVAQFLTVPSLFNAAPLVTKDYSQQSRSDTASSDSEEDDDDGDHGTSSRKTKKERGAASCPVYPKWCLVLFGLFMVVIALFSVQFGVSMGWGWGGGGGTRRT